MYSIEIDGSWSESEAQTYFTETGSIELIWRYNVVICVCMVLVVIAFSAELSCVILSA